MPHIIVIHSHNNAFGIPILLEKLHASLTSHKCVNKNQTKTYALGLAHSIVGDETRPNDMIHIQVRMKPGRSEELRTSMAQNLHDTTCDHLRNVSINSSVSVEICELHDLSYQSSYI